MKKAGKVVVLDGASSSGKTTLARAIQDQASDVFLHCQLDMFWNMTPSDVPAGSKNFPYLKKAMAQSVRALANTGHNVVVDTVLGSPEAHAELRNELENVESVFVKVFCPLDVLEAREIKRGNRRVGLAKSQLSMIHQGMAYDLELDTNAHSPEMCAKIVMSSLHEMIEQKA